MKTRDLILQLVDSNITNYNNFNTDVRTGIEKKGKQTSAYPNIDIDDFKKKFIDCNFTNEQLEVIEKIVYYVTWGTEIEEMTETEYINKVEEEIKEELQYL
jgi:hypothetical protein